jgi:hypothetical protein
VSVTRVSAALVFLVFFGFYVFLSFPGSSPYRDAGDLAAAAVVLGVPHPPGYPAYVLTAGAWQRAIPLSNSAHRLNLFSALCGAGAVMAVFLVLRRFTGFPGAMAGAVLAGLFPPAVAQNLLSEIYALHALWALALIWAALRARALPDGPRRRTWILIFFLWGLGLGNHQTLLLMAPALIFAAVQGHSSGGRDGLLWTGAAALGLTIYAFLPARAAANAAYLWGEPATLQGFWNMVTRQDYGAGTLSTRVSSASAGDGVMFWLREWAASWGYLGMVFLVLAGVNALRKENRAWGVPLILVWILTGPFFGLLSRLRGGDLAEAILEPALALPGLVGAAALGMLFGRWARRPAGWKLLAAILFLGQAGFWGTVSFKRQNHRDNWVAADYAANLLRTFPPNSTLLFISDAAIFSLSYEQAARRRCPDLRLLVNADLAWRWRRYRKEFPDLFDPGQGDGGEALVRRQAGKNPVFTDGLQASLLDSLCPHGLAARATGPRRSPACPSEIEAAEKLWSIYTRRRPSRTRLTGDYYSRAVLSAVSGSAHNSALLLAEAGRGEAGERFRARALAWNPGPGEKL